MSFPPYPSYTDSGVAWLGEVPSHWTFKKIKRIASFEGGSTPARDNPGFWDGNIPWISPKDMKSEVIVSSEELITQAGLDQMAGRLIEVCAVLMVVRSGILRHTIPVALNSVPVALNQDMKALRFERGDCIPEFFLRWVQGLNDDLLLTWSKQGATVESIEHDYLAETAIPLPPIREQAAIAAFLGRETAKIDALVQEQRRLITLLKEKRQAVISHAVTKGLNPDAPMKDSGAEWLGEVPAHWTVKPLKYLVQLRSGGTPSKDRADLWDGAIPWASAKDLKGEILYDTIDHITDAAITEGRIELAPVGSILILVRGMMLARAFPVLETQVSAAINQDLKAITPRSDMCSGFIAWTLRGAAQESLDRCAEAGHGTKALRMDAWLSMPIACPPLDEQRAIIEHLKKAASQIDELISEAGKSIDLLDERRAALISAAVTGKIDVRGSAKVLPFPVDRARARGLIASAIIERSAHQVTFGRVKLQKIAYLAEAHAGVSELEGVYLREAAGPLDREMIRDMEREAGALAGIQVEQPDGGGSAVAYQLGNQRGAHRQELSRLLGDRAAKFDRLIDDIATIDTKGAEAVATLYAVWNDALINRETPSDMEIVLAVLSEWHPEKAKKFRLDELQTWLGWMRRHGLVPTGAGPKTSTGRLFT